MYLNLKMMTGSNNNLNCTTFLIFVSFLFYQSNNIAVVSSWVPTTPCIQKSKYSSFSINAPKEPSSYTNKARGYGNISPALYLSKKNKGVTKGGKIQVKLLQHIAGTGKAGDVIMVSPAFYENKLKREKLASPVTDEQVTLEKKETETKKQQSMLIATDLQSKLSDYTLEIKHKSGPEGHLYGGVSKKEIFNELSKQFPKGVLKSKSNKIISIKNKDENELDHDIKELGDYSIIMKLYSDIDAKFTVTVVSDK